MARVFVSVHETSGDNATSDLVQHLFAQNPGLEVEGLGGPELERAGMRLWKNTTADALVGIAEIVKHIPRLLREMRETAERVRAFDADVCVLADAPDYNIRLAKQIRRANPDVPIVYWLCPQIWGWRVGRVTQLRRFFDRRLCIVPFEPAWYRSHYTEAEFVGHPSVGRIAAYREALAAEGRERGTESDAATLLARWGLPADDAYVGVLPGSRGSEVRRLLGIQLAGVREANRRRAAMPDGKGPLRPLISVAPGRDPRGLMEVAQQFPELDSRFVRVDPPTAAEGDLPVPMLPGSSFDVAVASNLACVCSGTASLETAMLAVPQTVVYRVSPLTAMIARVLARVKYASLANLVLGRLAIPERLQGDCTPANIATDLIDLDTPTTRDRLARDYASLAAAFGPPGAAERAAGLLTRDYLQPDIETDAAAPPDAGREWVDLQPARFFPTRR